MKRITALLLLLTMIFTAICIVSCGPAQPDPDTVTRMTVDVNPSVEFMVDSENKVVSVTALNDDGAVLIAGEVFVGKSAEEAVELMLNVARETGFILPENTEGEAREVRISVSGDTSYARELYNSVKSEAESTLGELNITGTVKKVEALALDALTEEIAKLGIFTEEELEAMNDKELYTALKESRIETATLLTEAMRDAYNSAKEHEIKFAESEAMAEIIEAMGGLYTMTYNLYKTALDVYAEAINTVEELRYNTLVAEDSEYQQLLAALREAKLELIEKRTYVATLEIDGEEYASATVELGVAEDAYDSALAAVESCGELAEGAFATAISALKSAESSLAAIEDSFPAAIEDKLLEKATELEAAVNTAKDGFFEKFETEHADDIAAMNDALLAQKAALKASQTEAEAE